ncbi:hypothetical protein [Baekduia sp. Peel2402]|uniref:hypothetical protein n=1 Tax=Baekduia sp. Peel2402 TaxID=3458296 RepID=UPI00403ECBFB
MTTKVVALGLGAPLADPISIWPVTTVIELVPEAAEWLGDDPASCVRAAIAAQAGVAVEAIEAVTVTRTPASALVQLARGSDAERALDVAARRRATNAAEALHAAVLALA